METNPVPKTNRNIMKYLSLGVAGLAMIGGSYLLFKRVQNRRKKDFVLKIFQEIRKEMFPIVNRLKVMHDNALMRTGSVALPQPIGYQLLMTGNSKIIFCYGTIYC